ncbi:hypothetical protein [Chamaesiphon polymorphus]|uniref:hypothetical protein n=1 Tax=Chamaesiphon polymorphus TaxID=2107691 RepID=UPI0011B25DC7|nr:hypothetical protein [Chamaesiphon polymorphus]
MHSFLDRCRYTHNLNGSALRESQIDLSQLVAKISRRSRRRFLVLTRFLRRETRRAHVAGVTHAEGTSARLHPQSNLA